jgi:hypothetical protein
VADPGHPACPILVVLMASTHAWTPEPRQTFSRIALVFAVAYAVVVSGDNFVLIAEYYNPRHWRSAIAATPTAYRGRLRRRDDGSAP